jgi:hypothetical protein
MPPSSTTRSVSGGGFASESGGLGFEVAGLSFISSREKTIGPALDSKAMRFPVRCCNHTFPVAMPLRIGLSVLLAWADDGTSAALQSAISPVNKVTISRILIGD